MQIKYQWDIETVDNGDGEVFEHDVCLSPGLMISRLKQLPAWDGSYHRPVLLREVWDGDERRSLLRAVLINESNGTWSLPRYYTDSAGNRVLSVPSHLRDELRIAQRD